MTRCQMRNDPLAVCSSWARSGMSNYHSAEAVLLEPFWGVRSSNSSREDRNLDLSVPYVNCINVGD